MNKTFKLVKVYSSATAKFIREPFHLIAPSEFEMSKLKPFLLRPMTANAQPCKYCLSSHIYVLVMADSSRERSTTFVANSNTAKGMNNIR